MRVNLEELLGQVTRAIIARVDLPAFQPGEVSCWIKFVKLVSSNGSKVEENVGQTEKLIFDAHSPAELVRQVAENALLTVYGAEVPIVADMPNLIVKLFGTKVFVPMEGAPPLDKPGQIFLKVTVYRYDPGLWEQLFPRRPAGNDRDTLKP